MSALQTAPQTKQLGNFSAVTGGEAVSWPRDGGDVERRLCLAFLLILSVGCEGIFQHIILKILILWRKSGAGRDHLSSNLLFMWRRRAAFSAPGSRLHLLQGVSG